jgi:hypothetical protein
VAGQEHDEDGAIVDDRGRFPIAGEQVTRPSPGRAHPAASAPEPPAGRSGWVYADGPVEDLATIKLAPDQPAEEPSAAPTVTAEWALWGKEGHESAYHVLRCSKGVFSSDEYREIITRYAPGVKGELPQYTVCWTPVKQDGQRYIVVGIHELADADPRRSGGRARTAEGREIEYVRLFCVRYADLADHGTGYADLIEAVRNRQLPADLTGPVEITLPEGRPYSLSGPLPQTAANVATSLLTADPVCVLGAAAATAMDRLVFIDLVMSLLPYGLRTTMSASTWASSTAQDLKLRLFFTNARRDDQRTWHVTWGRPEERDLHDDEPAAQYGSWLRSITPARAVPLLVEKTDPVRFALPDLSQMVGDLPADKPAGDTLQELAHRLRSGDQDAVRRVVRRLNRYLAGGLGPAERQDCLRLITGLRLLENHPELHSQTRESVYRVLLKLAFDTTLTYDSFCRIEDAAGGKPTGALRSVMTKFTFSGIMPWVLTMKAERQYTTDQLIDHLAAVPRPATQPLDEVRQSAETIRPDHRRVVYDFAWHYLRKQSAQAGAELRRRGYLTDTLEACFPRDQQAQQDRLEDTLRLVYGASLNGSQINDVFTNPVARHTPALGAAVRRLSSSSRVEQAIARRVAYDQLVEAGYGDAADQLIGSTKEGSFRERFRLSVLSGPDTIGMIPKRTIRAALYFLAFAGFLLFLIFVVTRL